MSKNWFQPLGEEIRSVPLKILVWGSGKHDKVHYKKRKKIKRGLKKAFPKSQVFFSEDPELDEMLEQEIGVSAQALNLARKEVLHLRYSDIAIALDTSLGVASEIALIVGSSYGHKLYILTDEQFEGKKSFAASVRENANQEFYTRKEFEECSLVQRAVERCRDIALVKLIGF